MGTGRLFCCRHRGADNIQCHMARAALCPAAEPCSRSSPVQGSAWLMLPARHSCSTWHPMALGRGDSATCFVWPGWAELPSEVTKPLHALGWSGDGVPIPLCTALSSCTLLQP